jgi:[protein-PII] uridylyltransferase
MQYDLFHIYTVDEHTLFVMNNIAAFSRPESRHDFPLCHQVMMEIPQRELLLLGALFHDIGKGRGGDHSEIGAIEAHKFCKAHGLSKQETDIIVWLVADHLVMSMTAQRKDITDPEVIHQFASRVGSVENLNYIYLLTVADICATSHTLWNNWKDTLLSELYKLTRNALERGLENKVKTKDLINEVKSSVIESLKAKGFTAETVLTLWQNFKDDYFVRNPVKRIAWQTRKLLRNKGKQSVIDIYRDAQSMATELFVYMPKHKGYFTHITTMIYRKNLSIQDASLHTTEDDYMMGSFVLLESDGSAITDPGRGKGLKTLLMQDLQDVTTDDIEGIQKPPHRYQHFEVPTEVIFSVDENGQRTMVEITTMDRPGLLAEIGLAFQSCDVELQSAKVVTLGEKVEDVFYITNPDQSLLTGQQELTLKMAIIDRLSTND